MPAAILAVSVGWLCIPLSSTLPDDILKWVVALIVSTDLIFFSFSFYLPIHQAFIIPRDGYSPAHPFTDNHSPNEKTSSWNNGFNVTEARLVRHSGSSIISTVSRYLSEI